MRLTLNIAGIGGHTEVSFARDSVLVKWNASDRREKASIRRLVEKARAHGLEPRKAGKGGGKIRWLGLAMRKAEGEIALDGPEAGVRQLALEMVEEEVSAGRLTMELQGDGSWRVLKAGDFKPGGGKEPAKPEGAAPKAEEKPQVVTSHAKVAGG